MVQWCTACYQCAKNKNNRCALDSDPVNEWIGKMVEAEGIIVGFPACFIDATTEVKERIDRAGFVSRKMND